MGVRQICEELRVSLGTRRIQRLQYGGGDPAPTDVVKARDHAAGRAFGKTIHAEKADVDGLVYASRLTGEGVYAIYDRSVVKLKAGDVGRLEEHVDLPAVLARHGMGLLAYRSGVWCALSAAG